MILQRNPTLDCRADAASSPRTGPGTIGLLGLILLLFIGMACAATPASAWAPGDSDGQPGIVDLPQVSVSDLAYAWQPATLTFNSSVGATAQRSPAHSGAQVIVATYFLERWNGQAWVTITQKQYVVQLAANQAEVKIPAIYFQPTSGTGYYRMTFGFVWMLAGASTFLGTQRWVPNGANDHACVTTLRPCEAGADSVRVGKLYRLGGGW